MNLNLFQLLHITDGEILNEIILSYIKNLRKKPFGINYTPFVSDFNEEFI